MSNKTKALLNANIFYSVSSRQTFVKPTQEGVKQRVLIDQEQSDARVTLT